MLRAVLTALWLMTSQADAAAPSNTAQPATIAAALAREEAGDAAGAMAALRRLVSEQPSWELPRIELARLELESGAQLADAEQQLRKALERVPGNPRANFLLGSVLVEQGRTREGEAALEAAVAARPDYVDPRLKLVGLYLAAGDDLHAEAHARTLTRAHPELTLAQLQLAEALDHQGRTEDAAQQLRLTVAEHPESLLAKRRLADLEEKLGHAKAAENLRDGLDPSTPRKKMRKLPKSRR